MVGISSPDEPIQFDLSNEERQLLERGVFLWGGPIRQDLFMLRALGVSSIAQSQVMRGEILASIEQSRPLTRRQWAQALGFTEVAFASNLFGAGWEWSVVTGWSDERTIEILRSVQDKLLDIRASHLRPIEIEPK